MSSQLWAAFGLRHRESIKIRPAWAGRGDTPKRRDIWTKGGRTLGIPVRKEEQRWVLDEARRIAIGGSLSSAGNGCGEQLRRIKDRCGNTGIHRMHAPHHRYAQTRYRHLTGWVATAR